LIHVQRNAAVFLVSTSEDFHTSLLILGQNKRGVPPNKIHIFGAEEKIISIPIFLYKKHLLCETLDKKFEAIKAVILKLSRCQFCPNVKG
jgi:hypothetical protein